MLHFQKDCCLFMAVMSLIETDLRNLPQKDSNQNDKSFYVWLNLVVLLPNFSWSPYKGWHEWKNSQYFQNTLYWIQKMASLTDSMTDRNMELVNRKVVLLIVPNFPWNNYLQRKRFYFTWKYLFLRLTQFRKDLIPLKIVTFDTNSFWHKESN